MLFLLTLRQAFTNCNEPVIFDVAATVVGGVRGQKLTLMLAWWRVNMAFPPRISWRSNAHDVCILSRVC
jgi:hypothetical protein